MLSMEEYIDKLQEDGFITADAEPIKCFYCESENISHEKHMYVEHRLVECEARCTQCKSALANWVYGTWIVE